MTVPISPMFCVLVLALGSGASTCMKPNPLIYAVAEAGTESGGDSESSGDSESGSDSESGGDSESEDSTESGGEDEQDTEFPQIPDVADSEPNTCAPLDAFNPECGMCLGSSCCELALACEAVEDCPCLAACLFEGGSNGTCKNACNGTKADMPELDPLLDCMDELCDAAC
ncbi:hypothetical protein DB30_05810 [Enhygromyxa salina]|uniref:Uncharacterized protein n=1 Tax=Enhygromyxa salina TaxID=215803 RepID=A0A0C2CW54_9BACT|nr:hypothetical protein [Enhygromyxa salina]KIG15266.1 hypothetical protein DB30_05810 [Enhygromyxa salina]